MLYILGTAPKKGVSRPRTLYSVKRLKADTYVLHTYTHSVVDVGQSKQDNSMVSKLETLALTG